MDALFFLVPLAILLGAGFAVAFLWAVQDGQYDDVEDAAERILHDD